MAKQNQPLVEDILPLTPSKEALARQARLLDNAIKSLDPAQNLSAKILSYLSNELQSNNVPLSEIKMTIIALAASSDDQELKRLVALNQEKQEAVSAKLAEIMEELKEQQEEELDEDQDSAYADYQEHAQELTDDIAKDNPQPLPIAEPDPLPVPKPGKNLSQQVPEGWAMENGQLIPQSILALLPEAGKAPTLTESIDKLEPKWREDITNQPFLGRKNSADKDPNANPNL